MTGLRLWLLACLCAALAVQGQAKDLKAPLSAEVRFAQLDGSQAAAVAPGDPVRLRVTIQSTVAQEAPAGLSLFGWLRRVDPDAPACGAAAEAFLRTGRLPVGTVFMNDPVIGVVTQDNGFAVSDPDFSLATANILGAADLPEAPSALVADPGARRFLLAMPDRGEVWAMDAAAGLRVISEGLDSPLSLVPGPEGAVLVQTREGKLAHLAANGSQSSVMSGLRRLSATAHPEWSLAMTETAGHLLRVTGQGAKPRTSLALAGLRDVVALSGFDSDAPFAMALLGDRTVVLHYLDAVDRPVRIPLPDAATRLAAAPDGRVILAWSPGVEKPVMVIDVARSRVVRQTRSDVPVSEISFSETTAFMMLSSQTHVGALDLNAVARGEAAEFREIQIGTAAPDAGHSQLLAPLWPMEGMLAVHAPSYQGYRIMDGSVMGDAPAMTKTTLRGGIPRLVASLDRSFREVERGVFETVTSLPGKGRFELVTTTGLGGISFCSEIPVAFPDADESPAEGRMRPVTNDSGLRLSLVRADGTPAAGVTGTLTFAALRGGWRAVVKMSTDDTGLSRDVYRLPALEGIVVQYDAPGEDFAPLLLEDPA